MTVAPFALTRAARASAQRSIRFICPFPAGGTIDAVMRAITGELASMLGQPVIVDVQSGGNGALAAQQLLVAPPDGQTWMMATLGTTLALMTRPAAIDPARDMRGLALVAQDVSVLVVSAASPVQDLSGFLAAARHRRGALNYLRTGEASLSHLVVECLNRRTGAGLQAVDYRGLPPGILDLIAGRLDLAVLTVGLALPQIRAGYLRALAIVAPRRIRDLPDVPTLSELDFAEANVVAWAAAVARAGTPEPVLASIRQAFARALADDAVRRRIAATGVVPRDGSGPDTADALLQQTYPRLVHLLAALGLREAPPVAESSQPAVCVPGAP